MPSMPAGVEYARATSGWFRVLTSSTLLAVHAARSTAHAAADIARMEVFFIVVGSSWGSYRPAAGLAVGRYTGSEARAQLERDAARIREPIVVDRVERRRPRGAAARTGFRIVALVGRPHLQVAADQRYRPVALPADPADAVAKAHFAKLDVRSVLHRHRVRPEGVVEAPDTRQAVPWAPTEVVSERLGHSNGNVQCLALLAVREVAERPRATDVPHAVALDGVEQRVGRELLEREVLRERIAEVRERLADRLVRDRMAEWIVQDDRVAPAHGDAPWRGGRSVHCHPQVLRDAFGQAVAARPHDQPLLVLLEVRGGAAALA